MGGVGANLTSARTAQGKGVPLPVAGNKLQNLPPQLTVYAHMLVLHRLMGDAALYTRGRTYSGRPRRYKYSDRPMLAQKEFLALQQLQLRVVSLSGGKPTELGQAVFILDAAASGRPYDFDVTVERMTVPAGFNLRGTVNVVWTKTLGDEHFQAASMSSSGREKDRGLTSGRSRKHDLSAPFTRSGTGLGSRRWSCGSSTPPGRLSEEERRPRPRRLTRTAEAIACGERWRTAIERCSACPLVRISRVHIHGHPRGGAESRAGGAGRQRGAQRAGRP